MEAHLWFTLQYLKNAPSRFFFLFPILRFKWLTISLLFNTSYVYAHRWDCAAYRRFLSYSNLVVGNEDEFRALAQCAGLVNHNEPIASVARKIADLEYISPANQVQSCLLTDFQG